ncbi:hypothetical protein PM082_024610 [Marasmius tenuissimus]|nr:hypothetical protein PM082_024610 [Marasmius tenuissimus]
MTATLHSQIRSSASSVPKLSTALGRFSVARKARSSSGYWGETMHCGHGGQGILARRAFGKGGRDVGTKCTYYTGGKNVFLGIILCSAFCVSMIGVRDGVQSGL